MSWIGDFEGWIFKFRTTPINSPIYEDWLWWSVAIEDIERIFRESNQLEF